jgi:TatD family-associated radical SAM protein
MIILSKGYEMSNILVYTLDGKIYINLTNRCTNDCIFCLRNDKDDVCGQTLWLDSEDFTAKDVIDQYEKILRSAQDNGTTYADEIVFCGYGEPMLKFAILKEVCEYIKEKYPNTKIRVNTNGHANFVYGRNVVPELKGLVDLFSVSLNGVDEDEYNELSQPKFDNAYEEVKKFIKACADEGIDVVASVVEGYKGRHINLEECERIASDLGAKFRAREWIPAGYN